MRKIFTILMALTLCLSGFAQKTDKVKVDYELDMLPMELISKDKKFEVIVAYDYQERTEAALDEIAKAKEDAAKEKEEYDKKSAGEKFGRKMLGEEKPTGRYNDNSFIPTVFPEEGIKGLVNIPGYSKISGSKGSVHVMFFEFSYTLDPTQTKISYYPLKIVVTTTNDKGQVVYQGDLPGYTLPTSYTATNAAALSKSMLNTLKSLEADAKNQAIKNLNAWLSKNYGFNLQKDERSFFDVKDKKQTYPEYHQAMEKVKTAFVYCNMADKQELMATNLKEAITIWETALKDFDKTNKAARINADIAAATYLNLAEANIWVKNFDKASEYLAAYKVLDQDYSRAYSSKVDFLKDYSSRYNKYQSY